MKLSAIAVSLVILWGMSACSSGNPSGRSDYANPAFGSAQSQRAARAAEIRKLHPNLTDKQVAQQLESEFPRSAEKN